MALPQTVNPASPADAGDPRQGAANIRTLTQQLADILGIPTSPTAITAAPFAITAAGLVTILQGPLYVQLTNKTGGGLSANDVVALDGANNSAVALSDVQGSLLPFLIAQTTIANNAAGSFARSGIVTAAVTGAVTRLHYLRKSATTKVLEDSGTLASATTAPPSGTVGVALSSAVGPGAGTVTAYLFGYTVASLTTNVGCRVYHNVDQGLPIGTTAVAFNSERFDPTGMHDPAVNNSRVTIATTGVYAVTFAFRLNSSSTSYSSTISLKVNGATLIASVNDNGNSSYPDAYRSLSTIVALNATDYVEAIGVLSGAGVTLKSNAQYSPELSVYYLGS